LRTQTILKEDMHFTYVCKLATAKRFNNLYDFSRKPHP